MQSFYSNDFPLRIMAGLGFTGKIGPYLTICFWLYDNHIAGYLGIEVNSIIF